MRKIVVTLAATVFCSAAHATTGAELLQYDVVYGRGFVWGIATALTSIASKDQIPVAQYRRDCFVNGKIDDFSFYAAVTTWIKNHPAELARDAAGPIIAVINEMCGMPPGAPPPPN
ncbi:hypothetical protein [Mesorhizobium sp.]|uniref:hypothetical protein n=1 Tax=Mesorhizobium sp. TaxID=1871066 RepID=UPI00120B3556|nr:hypothetical protein [Mesorhizobium sp.]TIQ46748.1 MAG: hypothetical protein E5X47_23425 [Mesorhizobium sp.]TIQ56521.1 MAG: hypothetical protein E5X46_18790 [Mesorhizobium sp.]